VKAGKRAAKFEDKMDGREECRTLTECWRENKKNTEKKERKKYYHRNGYASEEVERLRAKGRWMNVENDTDKQGRRERIKESRYKRVREVYDRGVHGQRVQDKEKWWRDLDVGTRREKTGIRWKQRKEGAEFAMRREKTMEHMWNGCSEIRGRERNVEKYWMKTEDGRGRKG
jgi:hypothetical protein